MTPTESAIQGDNTVDRVVLGRGKDVEHFTIDLWRPPYQVLTRGNMGSVDGDVWREHRVDATILRWKHSVDHEVGHVKLVEVFHVEGPLLAAALSSREQEHLRGAIRRATAAMFGIPVKAVRIPKETTMV